MSNPYGDIIQKAAKKYQVPPELIDSIIKHESSGRVGAIGPGFKSNGVIKHAYGLMQIHQDNFSKYGVKDWKNPEQNIHAGARLLSEYYQQAGNWYDAVGYYNAGPTGWRRNKKGVMAQSPEYYKGIYSFLDEFTMKNKFINPASVTPAKADNTMRLIPVSPIQENTLKGMNDVKPVVNTSPVRMATEGTHGMDPNTLMQLYENPSLATDLNFLSQLSLPRLAGGGKNIPKAQNGLVNEGGKPQQNIEADNKLANFWNQKRLEAEPEQSTIGPYNKSLLGEAYSAYQKLPPGAQNLIEIAGTSLIPIPGAKAALIPIPGAKAAGKFIGKAFQPIMKATSKEGVPAISTGIKSAEKAFQSEINWGAWNKEIPGNKSLMKEYNAIERVSKAKRTWMKNPDGSTFSGTPEQFIQQQSSNFKKAFGESKLVNPDGSPTIQYHGSAKKFDTFDESKFQLGDAGYSGQGIYTTPSKVSANSYALSSARNHIGDIEPTIYELYGQANNPISSSNLIREGKGRDIFNFHRKSNGKGNLTPEESLMEFDVSISDQLPNVQNIRPWHDARELVFSSNKQLKSAVGNNGMFDMTNPNIYKGLVPPLFVGSQYVNSRNK